MGIGVGIGVGREVVGGLVGMRLGVEVGSGVLGLVVGVPVVGVGAEVGLLAVGKKVGIEVAGDLLGAFEIGDLLGCAEVGKCVGWSVGRLVGSEVTRDDVEGLMVGIMRAVGDFEGGSGEREGRNEGGIKFGFTIGRKATSPSPTTIWTGPRMWMVSTTWHTSDSHLQFAAKLHVYSTRSWHGFAIVSIEMDCFPQTDKCSR